MYIYGTYLFTYFLANYKLSSAGFSILYKLIIFISFATAEQAQLELKWREAATSRDESP